MKSLFEHIDNLFESDKFLIESNEFDSLVNDIYDFFADYDPYGTDIFEYDLNIESIKQALSNADEEAKLISDLQEISKDMKGTDDSIANRADELVKRLQMNEDQSTPNKDELRKKYFGNNLDLYNQPEEVIKEINSKNFFIAKNFKQVLDDYENNPDSDWYIDVIKIAQERIAERKERKELANQEKAQQDAIAREEREYKQAKRKLALLRKNHSTNVDLIDRLYHQVKDYEATHDVTEMEEM